MKKSTWWLIVTPALIVFGIGLFYFNSTEVFIIESMTLYSIDGNPNGDGREAFFPGKVLPEGESLHGCPVLGKVAIESSSDRDAIYAAVNAGLNSPEAERAACFYPRHAIRVSGGGKATDYVVCFSCGTTSVCRNQRLLATEASDDTAKDLLNHHLKAAGIPLAPPPLKARD